MTEPKPPRSARALGTLLADIGGREALRALGVLGPTLVSRAVRPGQHDTRRGSESHPTWAGYPLS